VSADSGHGSLREKLLEVVTALWFDIDHQDGTSASGFFLPDGEVRFGDRAFRGTAEIDALYAARAGRGPRVSRHVVTNLHVTSTGPGTATAVSIVTLFAEDGEPPRPAVTPAMVGDVTDVFEQRAGRWLIRSRRIEQLFIAPATVLAVPFQ
jgi:hypothetical protein